MKNILLATVVAKVNVDGESGYALGLIYAYSHQIENKCLKYMILSRNKTYLQYHSWEVRWEQEQQ